MNYITIAKKTMDKHLNNISILKDFISINEIKKYKVSFPCSVTITTAQNEETIDCGVRMTFDDFDDNGVVSLICDLDANLYPTVFRAKFCTMDLEHAILVITDTHTRNSAIGKYKVSITSYV